MTLYQSLYETALKQGLPRPIIDELVRVFANDVDYQRSTAPGDSIEAFLSEPDDIDPHPELLFATMTARDQIFKYYRFETPDDGLVDYYDENGRSTRKFLIRKPIVDGVMTFAFRHALPPDPALRPHAHRRRLDGADRHADSRRRLGRHHQGGLRSPATADGSRSSTPTATSPPTIHMSGFAPRHRRGRACHAGPDRSAISASRVWRPGRISITK